MIENMKVRRFKEEDAQEVRNLIVRNFLEVNSKDYGISAMEKLAKVYDVEKVLNVASYAHMYVFEFDRVFGNYVAADAKSGKVCRYNPCSGFRSRR